MKVPLLLINKSAMSSENLRFSGGDSNKAFVADILSTMSRDYPTTGYMPTSFINGGINTSSGALALTPNTLAAVGQSFIELQSVQSNNNQTALSGFVPPVVTSSTDNSIIHSDDMSSDGSEWEMARGMQISKDSGYQYANVSRSTPGRKRRHANDEELSPEEDQKRRIRRERNKVAAAKCRQRRVDHTNVLIGETEELEEEQRGLEDEIQSLQQQKDQLEFLLQAHQPLCAMDSGLKMKHDTPITTSSEILLSNTRPSSLPLNLKKPKDSESDSLITPSANYSFALDSLIGSTGLTPVSTGLTPLSSGLTPFLTGTGLTPITSLPCSSEAQKISSDISEPIRSSPTRLVSL